MKTNRIKVTIIGKVPAKASCFKVFYNKKTGKPFVKATDVCDQYVKDFLAQVTSIVTNAFMHKERLAIIIDWYADSYRQDIDSPAKIIFDCLHKYTKKIIANDNQFDFYAIRRLIDKTNPRVDLTIQRITADTKIEVVIKEVKL